MTHERQPEQGLSRRQRILHTSSFAKIYAQRRCTKGKLMRFWRGSAPDSSLRLGVVAGKKVGNAVCRARAKRMLREAWRLNRHRFCGDIDVILTARSDILDADLRTIEEELCRLAKKAGILAQP